MIKLKREFVEEGIYHQRLFLAANGHERENMKRVVRMEDYQFRPIKQKDGSFKPGKLLKVDFIRMKKGL